jgi:hypothetical protein
VELQDVALTPTLIPVIGYHLQKELLVIKMGVKIKAK